MRLLGNYLKKEFPTYIKKEISFKTICNISKFSSRLQKQTQKLKEETRHFKKLIQVLTLNYSSQDKIALAVEKLKESNQKITPQLLEENIESSKFGPVDRLSVEVRNRNSLIFCFGNMQSFSLRKHSGLIFFQMIWKILSKSTNVIKNFWKYSYINVKKERFWKK